MATVGVEIELTMPRSSQQFRDIASDYSGNYADGLLPSGWKVKSDSSIQPDYNHFGLEVVSPVIDAKVSSSLRQISTVAETLAYHDGKPHETCGMHVHVDASGLTRNYIDAIVQFFRVHEFAFYGLNGSGIEERMVSDHAQTYCRPSTMWGRNVRRERYQSLNLTNVGIDGKNTVECRVWQSTLDTNIIYGAILMFHCLVEGSKAAVRQGSYVPHPDYDLRITSPVKAMSMFTDMHFKHREFLPEVDDATLESVKKTMMIQAVAAEKKLNEI
jgi:hypothetical protein